MFHSEHRQIERMRHYRPWPLMEIHPDTAAKYGIKDGDWVWMEGPLGRAKRKAKLTPIMDRRHRLLRPRLVVPRRRSQRSSTTCST